MSVVSINHIKDICKELDIRLAKSKGQNFLINKGVRDRIIQAAGLRADDKILEIGPGLGVLTEELVKKSKVTAVELDKKLYSYLKNKIYPVKSPAKGQVVQAECGQFSRVKKIELVQADILEFLDGQNRFDKVIANLPYQITSHVLKVMLEKNIADEYILMVQKEVGERIAARPGKMSMLAVMVQYYSQPKILFKVNKGNFWPRPKVDSVVVRLKAVPLRQGFGEQENFFKLVKEGFRSKRKMLKNNLGNSLEAQKALKEVGLDEKVRAQDLSVKDWLKLYTQLGN